MGVVSSLSTFRLRFEILLISQRDDVLQRVQQKAVKNNFSFYHASLLSDLSGKNPRLEKVPVLIVSQEDTEHVGAFSLRVEQLLEKFPLAFIVAAMYESSLEDTFAGTQSERVIPLSPFDFFKTSKLEYICLQKCRSQFYDIVPSDLFSMTTLGFDVFARLNLNQRYLGVAFRGSVLGDSKHQKMLKRKALYVQSEEIPAYLEYVNSFYDTRGASLRKRVRALFLATCVAWVELNEFLLFEYKNVSDERVRQLYSQLEQYVSQFEALVDVGEDLWETLKDAVGNDFLAKWRSPWIAFYAAYISKKSGVGKPGVAFISGLLCDVGLFDISDDIVEKAFVMGEESLAESETAEYRKHPVLSLNRCLLKNLTISEEIKTVLVCVHEREDAAGFPSQTPPEMLPAEAAIIRFASLIDQKVLRSTPEEGFRMLKEKLWEEQRSQSGNFNSEFLDKISESLL